MRLRDERIYKFGGYLGWILCLGITAFLFFLPIRAMETALSLEVTLLLVLGIMFFSWVGLMVGAVLLMIRYPAFFKTIKGVALFLSLFALDIWLAAPLLYQTDMGWFSQQLFFLLTVWISALPFILLVVLSAYLWFQDKAARLLAVTLLTIVWAFAIHIRDRSAAQLLLDMIQMSLPAWLTAFACFSQMVVVIAPLFFLGHSLRLFYREIIRSGLDDVMVPDKGIGAKIDESISS